MTSTATVRLSLSLACVDNLRQEYLKARFRMKTSLFFVKGIKWVKWYQWLTSKNCGDTSWDSIWTGMRIFVFFNKLTLNLLSCILFVVVLSCSFIAWKNQSARHCKNSHFALCSQVASDILQSRKICRKQLFVQPSGIKELAFHAITATLICTAQTAFILLPLPERLFAVF